MAGLDRHSFTVGGHDVRLYHDPLDEDDPSLATVLEECETVSPSVTSVLNFRHDPDKDDAIQGWKNYFDGSCSRQSPHWSDQQVYKQYRGTLAHYAVLSQLTDLDRGEEEETAEEGLRYWFRHAPTADVDDIDDTVLDATETYWVCLRKGDTPQAARKQAEGGHGVEVRTDLDNTYDGVRAWERAMREINTVCELFESNVTDGKGLTPNDIVTVEEYVTVENPVPFAGQADLVYEHDGNTVLADLKTSGKIRTDYKLQLGGYAFGLPHDIDVVETISIDPEDRTVTIETNEDWNRSVDSLSNEFLGLCARVHADELDL